MDFYLAAVIQALCFGPLALGLFLSMKIFRIPDITSDGSYTLGAVITVLCLAKGVPLPLTCLLAMVGGALAGCCTALIHTRLRINPLLAGILVMTALYSVNLTLMGRSNIPLLGGETLFSLIHWFGYSDLNSFTIVGILLVCITIALGYLLSSDFGLAMRATGESESMIRALGVNTDRMKVFGLALANGLIALSGCLMSQFQGFTDINMGIGIVISGLGSVIIGETLISILRLTGMWGSLFLVVAGAVIFQLALAVTLAIGVDANLLKLVTALLVLLIVALPYWTGLRRQADG
ncbi:putative ABC transport system permease protein [bacterium A37T11]|nr:putative ABC transport system permease protein [bacterium A37T11]